jgi:hypothetical protein
METTIIAKDLYNVLLNYREYRNNNGMEPDDLLDGIIDDWKPTLPSSWRDAEAYLKDHKVNWKISCGNSK